MTRISQATLIILCLIPFGLLHASQEPPVPWPKKGDTMYVSVIGLETILKTSQLHNIPLDNLSCPTHVSSCFYKYLPCQRGEVRKVNKKKGIVRLQPVGLWQTGGTIFAGQWWLALSPSLLECRQNLRHIAWQPESGDYYEYSPIDCDDLPYGNYDCESWIRFLQQCDPPDGFTQKECETMRRALSECEALGLGGGCESHRLVPLIGDWKGKLGIYGRQGFMIHGTIPQD